MNIFSLLYIQELELKYYPIICELHMAIFGSYILAYQLNMKINYRFQKHQHTQHKLTLSARTSLPSHS